MFEEGPFRALGEFGTVRAVPNPRPIAASRNGILSEETAIEWVRNLSVGQVPSAIACGEGIGRTG